MSHFEKVKDYITELGFRITEEDPSEELIVINDIDRGIQNLVIDCEDPILIFEQAMFPLNGRKNPEVLLGLLKMNRNLVHGSFVVDQEGQWVIFRDTLQLENLDLNEIEGTINALSLAVAEYFTDLINFSKAE